MIIFGSHAKNARVIAMAIIILAFTGCKEVTDFIDSISDGAPCGSNAECLGSRCLTEGQGYPNGYCTTLSCDTAGCSGFSSECFNTEIEGQAVTACFELCDFDGTCQRADEGYVCVTLEDTAVCLPPGATNAPRQGATGSACSTNLQCNGDNATCLTSFFGGYCSQTECDSVGCLEDNPCLSLNPDDPEADQNFACFQGCSSDDDCRFQYSCQDYQGSRVCLEGESSTRNPDGVDDGEPCVANINCKGGTCIREAKDEESGDVSFPGGYCTTRDCDDSSECHGDAVCAPRARNTTCLATCESASDCRDGYDCIDTPEGKACDSKVPQIIPDPVDTFDIECQSSKTATFTIPDGSAGFYVLPYTQNGEKIVPKTLDEPGGVSIDIPTEYEFMAINPEILGSLAPIMFPGGDASEYRDRFQSGEHSLTVETNADEWCYYVIPQDDPGTTLGINLYFVGVDGINASQAESDNDVAAVMDVVEDIYDQMNINASVANYFDASEDVAAAYSTIRDFNDIYNLVATSQPPGSSKEDALTVNVFLINDFNISEAPGLLGVSTGIPGVAGLHGSSGSGLVFTASSLGNDNQQLGQTMAHEIGHFVGLRHTTEHYGLAHDPITDTPECLAPDLATFCPDSDNFMFAFALGGAQTVVTNGQTYVVRRNPLVQ